MKNALFLVDDRWHSGASIEPLVDKVFDNEEWNVIFSNDPEKLYNSDLDLIVTFKDPLEDNTIPTPMWTYEKWTECCLKMVESGTGFLAFHAGTLNLPEDHKIVKNLTHAVFITHPEQCELKVDIIKSHPVTEGVDSFTLPVIDEHYHMKIVDEDKVTILANTVSKYGTQPGLWVSEYGKGRICCFTPGHTTESLTSDGFVKIMKNAVKWCERD
ncbi:MAG: ThuA domain-containing protein [Lachnospiraceae bacterium]|nr:ThuA domain-containing protein [Lachnospiraceae bacterium]